MQVWDPHHVDGQCAIYKRMQAFTYPSHSQLVFAPCVTHSAMHSFLHFLLWNVAEWWICGLSWPLEFIHNVEKCHRTSTFWCHYWLLFLFYFGDKDHIHHRHHHGSLIPSVWGWLWVMFFLSNLLKEIHVFLT